MKGPGGTDSETLERSPSREDRSGSTLADRYRQVRRATEALVQGLAPEDCTPQSMPDASPVKWHLAHTSWFFETFVLEQAGRAYRPFRAEYRMLFNSYYQAVGEPFPRPRRGLVTRPGLEEIVAYREHVDREMAEHLASHGESVPPLAERIVLGLHHEQQHQELILTDLKHLFSLNPLAPVYRRAAAPHEGGVAPLEWFRLEGGVRGVGHEGPGFAFDNEGPRHEVLLRPFEIATRPVTVGAYRSFLEDGGYERPELWLSDGWDVVRREGWRAPLYWGAADGRRTIFTLAGQREARLDEPVCHVSFYEAEAFARWSGARLPTEQEWEVASRGVSVDGNFVEGGRFHPAPAESGPASRGPRQMFGDVWEWTASPYASYPGFRPAAGALGEYNGKFMCNQLVLRGGSCATPRSHVRPTYRNFFYPHARWQFSGIRLARDAG